MENTKVFHTYFRLVLPAFFVVLLLVVQSTFELAHALDQTSTGFYYPTGHQVGYGNWLATQWDGYPSNDGVNRYHLGSDITGAKRNDPVYAIADGSDVWVNYDANNVDMCFIWIKHTAYDPSSRAPISFWAVYGHIKKSADLGTSVKAGQTIGYVLPYTGGADHLHFGVNLSGSFNTVISQSMDYINGAGQISNCSAQIGWGRGAGLPNDWGNNLADNKSRLATRQFQNPVWFIQTYYAHFKRNTPADYFGDGVTDFAVFRPSSGMWYVYQPINAAQRSFGGFGGPGDIPVPGDYDGDGKADFAFYRPSEGGFYAYCTGGRQLHTVLGQQGDIPVPADYFGDGVTDFAVFRPSSGMWYVYQPINAAQRSFGGFGGPGDIPVPGDYDGDGKADFAFYRPSEGGFYAYCTGGRQLHTVLGQQGDIPVPADYFGDGVTDFAVFRPSSGMWYVYQPINAAQRSFGGFGGPGDIPVPGDYDGDGKADFAFYRPSEGGFYAYCTGGRQLHTVLGQQGDIPVTYMLGPEGL